MLKDGQGIGKDGETNSDEMVESHNQNDAGNVGVKSSDSNQELPEGSYLPPASKAKPLPPPIPYEDQHRRLSQIQEEPEREAIEQERQKLIEQEKERRRQAEEERRVKEERERVMEEDGEREGEGEGQGWEGERREEEEERGEGSSEGAEVEDTLIFVYGTACFGDV